MDSVDITQIISLMTKGGPAAIILAILIGLSYLVREVRGGKVSTEKEADLLAKITQMQTQIDTVQRKLADMENELDAALNTIHTMRYQRDQARVRVEFLEQVHDVQPRTVWPPEPEAKNNPSPA